MIKTKYLTGIIVFLSLMLLTPMAHAATNEPTKFKDVPKDSEFNYHINHLVKIGAISGYKDGTFKPNKNVTRGQAAKIITTALNMPLKNPKTPTFKDISRNHDYYKHIETLVAHGVIGGYPDGTFRAGKTLKRSHMAKVITNSMKLQNRSDITFKDVSHKNEFYPYVNKLAAINITTGYPDKTFRPNKNVTRAQIAAFISRGLNNWLSSDEIGFYKGLVLGMTQETVINFEGTPTYRDADTMEYDWVPYSEIGAGLKLYFTDNKLDHIIININTEKEGITADNSEDYFEAVLEMIYKPEFGEPTELKDKWDEEWDPLYDVLEAEWSLGSGDYYNIQMGPDGEGGYFFSTVNWAGN